MLWFLLKSVDADMNSVSQTPLDVFRMLYERFSLAPAEGNRPSRSSHLLGDNGAADNDAVGIVALQAVGPIKPPLTISESIFAKMMNML